VTCIIKISDAAYYRGRPAMAKYSFKARKYSLSSSGLRKTFGRSGNPAKSSGTGAAAHRTDVMVIVHSRTATSNSTVDSRAVIVKCMLKTSSHGGCQIATYLCIVYII